MSIQATAASGIRPGLPLTPPPAPAAVRSDSDGDHDNSGPADAVRAPSVNSSGQTVGQVINVAA